MTNETPATKSATGRTSPAAVHGVLFVALLVLVSIGLPSLVWPWYLLLPLLGYAAGVAAITPLRLRGRGHHQHRGGEWCVGLISLPLPVELA